MPALLALVPLLSGLFGGASLGTVLAGVTAQQWISIAVMMAKLAPAEVNLLKGLHPIFAAIHLQPLNLVPHIAGDWIKGNADKAIQLQPGAFA